MVSAVYQITNTITGDFYIGSSRNVKRRWAEHGYPSAWKHLSKSYFYQDIQKYGIDKFDFKILKEVEPEYLKEEEQYYIELLHPTYNNYNAKGLDIERYEKAHKKCCKKYQQSKKGKEATKKYQQSEKGKKSDKKYRQSPKCKEVNKKAHKKYYQSEKGKKVCKEYSKAYDNQLCDYNGEIITFTTLSSRFRRACIVHPTLEAKKYLVK